MSLIGFAELTVWLPLQGIQEIKGTHKLLPLGNAPQRLVASRPQEFGWF